MTYKVMMMVRASWISAASYRINIVLSLLSLIATVIPVYFISGALQPVMADAISQQGGQYFGFLIIGMVVFLYLTDAVNALPGIVQGGIHSGTLEAMFTTPTSLPVLLGGMMAYGFLWITARAAVLLTGAWVLGMQIAWGQLFTAFAILLLIVLAYIPVGMIGAALVLAFRTTGPLPGAVLLLSGLLGGVYYPTHVIPSWIRYVSDIVPLTYGLRALRRTLLEGEPLRAVSGDVTILALFAAALLAVGSYALVLAFRYSRRAGTLAQY
jgi:ABC-2 type transport system permease protein